MNYLTSEKFSFDSKAVDTTTFGVVQFSGSEGLSQLYHFDILLVADDPDIDMNDLLQEKATFYIHRPDGSKVPFHGMLAEFSLERQVSDFFLYRALLVPRLWRLTLTHHNQIFLDMDPENIIGLVLEDGGLTAMDYEFRLQGNYVTWEYACQYGESHYNFIARWMERNGMYYFFDQSGNEEKLVITDTRMSHEPSEFGRKITYSPVSGMETFHLDEAIQSYKCIQKTVPQKVLLKDYNYRTPSLEVKGTAEVSRSGFGEMYYYGDHFRTPEEGNKLARIRSEELLCTSKQFQGKSTVPYLAPGFTAQLSNHFRQDMNRDYLIVSMDHFGNQASALISGLREQLAKSEQETVYRNTFIAIEDTVQYRAERTTVQPVLNGAITAKIDASGSGKYAEIDGQGRYKVVLPFDRSGRDGGKASAWLRMMQPYGGSDHGMHFPLHKGTEVLLTFIEGNPDRPVIAGSVANPENPSQVTTDNQTMAKLTTSGGNKIHIEDKEGSERILMHSPNQESFVRIGSENDPDSGDKPPDPKPDPTPGPTPGPPGPKGDKGDKGDKGEDGKSAKKESYTFGDWDGIRMATGGAIVVHGTLENKVIYGESTLWFGGLAMQTYAGIRDLNVLIDNNTTVFGMDLKLNMGWSVAFKPFHKTLRAKTMTINGQTVTLGADKVSITGGTTIINGDKTSVSGGTTTVRGDNTEVSGGTTTVRGNNAQVSGGTTTITGNRNTVSGGTTTVSGNQTAVSGGVTTVNGDQTTVSGGVTTVTGDHTEVSGGATTITGGIITISDEEFHL